MLVIDMSNYKKTKLIKKLLYFSLLLITVAAFLYTYYLGSLLINKSLNLIYLILLMVLIIINSLMILYINNN